MERGKENEKRYQLNLFMSKRITPTLERWRENIQKRKKNKIKLVQIWRYFPSFSKI